jgi:hypothetical protein
MLRKLTGVSSSHLPPTAFCTFTTTIFAAGLAVLSGSYGADLHGLPSLGFLGSLKNNRDNHELLRCRCE